MTLKEVLAVAHGTPRPFSAEELSGMASRTGLANAVRRGELVRVLPCLYASSVHADSFIVRARAACMWAPEAAVSGASALFAYGACDEPPPRLRISMPRHAHRRFPEWVHVTRLTTTVPVAWWSGDIRLATPEYALALGYGDESAGRRAELVYRSVRQGVVRVPAALAALDRLPRVRGRASLVDRLELAARGVESFLEERGLRDLFLGEVLGRVLWQHTVRVGVDRYRIDAYDPVSGTAFELDGSQWHDGSKERLRDMRRDAALATIGIVTIRFGYRDVVERPRWCAEVARAAIAARGSNAWRTARRTG